MKKEKLVKIIVTALFCAVAFLMIFVFRFKVSFLTFDFKDAIISIVSLLYGPIYGITCAVTVALLEFLSVSDTGVYGLIMNSLSSGVFALTVGGVYRLKRSFNGAIMAAISSVISVTIVMIVANIFITPFYMGVSRSEVIAIIPALLLPFNICKTVINASALMIIYKPITNALRKTKLVFIEAPSQYRFTKRSVALLIVSIVLLTAASVFIILVLGGSFSFL